MNMNHEFWIYVGLTFGTIVTSVFFYNIVSKVIHGQLQKNIEAEITRLEEK